MEIFSKGFFKGLRTNYWIISKVASERVREKNLWTQFFAGIPKSGLSGHVPPFFTLRPGMRKRYFSI